MSDRRWSQGQIQAAEGVDTRVNGGGSVGSPPPTWRAGQANSAFEARARYTATRYRNLYHGVQLGAWAYRDTYGRSGGAAPADWRQTLRRPYAVSQTAAQ